MTDNLSRTIGAHQLKFGMDYRRLNPTAGLVPSESQALFLSLSNVLANSMAEGYISSRTANVQLAFQNRCLFAQDTWKATRSLTLTYGLRWEYNGAPTSPNGTLPYTVTGVNDLATMTLAPSGTPLWKAQKDDFAPRLGIAWQVLPNVVVRAGAGIFYDLGYSDVADGASAFPYAQGKALFGVPFPLSAAEAAPPPFTTNPPVSYLAVVNPNHVLPRTYEWNAAVEKSIGQSDVISVTYLGAAGRKLMRQDIYVAPNPNFAGEFDLMSNDADSSYQALQAQFRHRFAHGLQTLLSYTWAHSIDDDSSDAYFANVPPNDAPLSEERGSSDYDIRQTFSGAVSYNIPAPGAGISKRVFGRWSVDSIVYARTAPPVNVVTGTDPFPARARRLELTGLSARTWFREYRSGLTIRIPVAAEKSTRLHSANRADWHREIWDEMPCADSALPKSIWHFADSSNFASGFLFRREPTSSTSSTTPTLALPSTTSRLRNSGNRRRCWEPRWEAAVRMADSIRCIKSAVRGQCSSR